MECQTVDGSRPEIQTIMVESLYLVDMANQVVLATRGNLVDPHRAVGKVDQ